MKQSIKSKVILSTLLFAVVFAVAMFFATNSFATEELAEADSTPTAKEDVAASEEITATEESAAADENAEALPESTEAAATEESDAEAAAEVTPRANLDTVETPLGDTGVSIIGERTATDPSDYFKDTDGDYHILTEGWTLSGKAINPAVVYIKCDNINLENLDQTDKTNCVMLYPYKLNKTDNININIIGNKINIYGINGNCRYTLTGTGTLNIGVSDSYGKTSGALYNSKENLIIDGPTVLINLDTITEVPCPVCTEEGSIFINSGSLRCNINVTIAPAIMALGSIYVSDTAELYASSNFSFTVSSYDEDGFDNIGNYKTSTNFLPYEQKTQVTDSANIVELDIGGGHYIYALGIDGTETPAKTVYKPAGNPPEPTPPEPVPPVPGTEEVASAQTGDGSIAGIIMLVAITSGVCFASVTLRRKLINKA